MAQDLKHRVPAIQPKKPVHLSQRLKLIAGLAGITLLMLAAVIPRLRSNQPAPTGQPGAAPAVDAPRQTRVSFFKLLPEIEQQVPESEINAVKREKRPATAPAAGQFFLQVGAFPERDAAEALKQQLEAFGTLKPRLEQINLEFATWYRVKLGPYRTIPDAHQVRLFLRARGIDSIIQTPREAARP